MEMIKMDDSIREYVIQIRRELHANPELPHQEKRTSRRVCEELEKMGIPYTIVGENNVVASICMGEGPRTAVRADMDALPLQEELDVPWKSKVPGVMHACGHDGHTAGLLGTAKMIRGISDRLQGTIFLCFQAAEETGDCADEVVEYLKGEGGVDSCVSLHYMAMWERGEAELSPGARMAGADLFEIRIKGKGGHGSREDLVVSTVKIACDIYDHLVRIPVYEHNPFNTAVVNVCKIAAGSRFNVYSDSGELSGSIRYMVPEDNLAIRERIVEIARQVAQLHGGSCEVDFSIGAKYPVVNDAGYTEKARRILERQGMKVVETDPNMGSDNFAEYLHAFPGCYVMVGCASEREGAVNINHNVRFDLNEEALTDGVEFFINYIQEINRKRV